MGKKFVIYSLLVFLLCQVCTAQRKKGLLSGGFPKGTRIYKPDKCWNGYTMVPYEEGMIIIVDMKGNVVHHWEVGTERSRLLENGNVVVMQGSSIVEYDWDGKVVWECKVPGGPYREIGYPSPGIIHHDLQRLSNGNTIFIYHEEVPEEYKKVIKDPIRRSTQVIGDCILEVNKEKEIVWQWHTHQGLDLNEDSSLRAREGRHYDWTHTNTVSVLPENKWYDQGHKEFKPGNVMICARQLDEIYIIDRDTKDVVWRYRGEYLGGISRAHEPYMIEKGLPGAGNIIMFDNGTDRSMHNRDGKGEDFEITVVLEINPVTKQIVWMYQDGENFYSAIQGTQQRLPNGNTFICESTKGRLLEVTYAGEIVWEYVMPPFPGSDEEHGFGTRPHRYPYDYCPQLKQLPTPEQ
jgi:hypothetical protein